MTTMRTNNHGGELEALAHAFPVYLVGEVGKADVAHELLADDGGDAAAGLLLGEGGVGAVQIVAAICRDRVAVGGGNVRVRHLWGVVGE